MALAACWSIRGCEAPSSPAPDGLLPTAPALQQLRSRLRWVIYETVLTLRRPSLDYSLPPTKQNRHRLSLLRRALFRVLQSAASLSAPSLTGLPTWAQPAWCWMSPFVSEALGWLWWLESLNNNDESEYLFLRFFSKLPLHQLLNSSIQSCHRHFQSLLAWGSQRGKCRPPGNRGSSSMTPGLKGRHRANFSEKRREAYMLKLIFQITSKSLWLHEQCWIPISKRGDLFENCFMLFTLL